MSLRSKSIVGVRSLVNWGHSWSVWENTLNGKTLDYLFLISIFREKKKESYIICTQYGNIELNTKLRFPRLYSLSVVDFAVFARQYFPGYYFRDFNKCKTGKNGIKFRDLSVLNFIYFF